VSRRTAERSAERGIVRVVAYSSANRMHRERFRDLNLAWIERHFVVEPRDRHELDDPETHILDAGGYVFVAEMDAEAGVEVIGTCALVVDHGVHELVKMAVSESARGRGVGRALGEAAIEQARALGAPRVELLSNTVLGPAIALYRSLGFREVAMPPTEYARAIIKMVLEL
jgi:GNAT superfamily N-acetyltransferase